MGETIPPSSQKDSSSQPTLENRNPDNLLARVRAGEPYSESEIDTLKEHIAQAFDRAEEQDFFAKFKIPHHAVRSGPLNLERARQFCTIIIDEVIKRHGEGTRIYHEQVAQLGLDGSEVIETPQDHEVAHLQSLIEDGRDISNDEFTTYFTYSGFGYSYNILFIPTNIAPFHSVKSALAPKTHSSFDIGHALLKLRENRESMRSENLSMYNLLVEKLAKIMNKSVEEVEKKLSQTPN